MVGRIPSLRGEVIRQLADKIRAKKPERKMIMSVKPEEVIKTLFDKNGQRIPQDLKARVCVPDRDFRLDQPQMTEEVHYANRILRLHGKLGIDTGITAEQLQQETERLLVLIRNNSQIANITKGVWLPVVLPKLGTNDIGMALKQYLEAVGKSYTEVFPNRKFHNYRKGELACQVFAVKGSHHDQLIEQMKQGSVIGIHFPKPLQGFSVDASREQMITLPEGFILSGLDTAIAMVMYPDVLARNWYTPGLILAALAWQSAWCSFHFRASADWLVFYASGDLGFASYDYYCSGGLLFLG